MSCEQGWAALQMPFREQLQLPANLTSGQVRQEAHSVCGIDVPHRPSWLVEGD